MLTCVSGSGEVPQHLLCDRHAGELQTPLPEAERRLLLVQAVGGPHHVHLPPDRQPRQARAAPLQRHAAEGHRRLLQE